MGPAALSSFRTARARSRRVADGALYPMELTHSTRPRRARMRMRWVFESGSPLQSWLKQSMSRPANGSASPGGFVRSSLARGEGMRSGGAAVLLGVGLAARAALMGGRAGVFGMSEAHVGGHQVKVGGAGQADGGECHRDQRAESPEPLGKLAQIGLGVVGMLVQDGAEISGRGAVVHRAGEAGAHLRNAPDALLRERLALIA